MSFMVFIQTEESEQIEKIIMINEFNFDFNFDLNLITVEKIQGKRNIFWTNNKTLEDNTNKRRYFFTGITYREHVGYAAQRWLDDDLIKHDVLFFISFTLFVGPQFESQCLVEPALIQYSALWNCIIARWNDNRDYDACASDRCFYLRTNILYFTSQWPYSRFTIKIDRFACVLIYFISLDWNSLLKLIFV